MEWSLNSFRENSRMFKGWVFTAAFVILMLFLMACNTGNHEGQHEYYYYPEQNVYYDPAKKDFLYSLNGTKSWSTFTNAHDSEPQAIGKKVIIYSNNAEVYRDNENHRKLYKGRLYNIAPNTSTAAIDSIVTERKVFQKARSTLSKRQVNNKRKNGIGKFFNKIFGKNK